jgi:hypothetical protein
MTGLQIAATVVVVVVAIGMRPVAGRLFWQGGLSRCAVGIVFWLRFALVAFGALFVLSIGPGGRRR